MNTQSKALATTIILTVLSTAVLAQPNGQIIARFDARLDSPELKIGIGFTNDDRHTKYRYTREEERLLVSLHQTQSDLKDLKITRANLLDKLEDLYTRRHYSRKQVRRIEWQIQETNRDIRDTQRELANLEREWKQTSHRETCSLDNHFRYLEQNYRLSPNRLGFQNGYFRYSGEHQAVSRPNHNSNLDTTQHRTTPNQYAAATTPSNTLSQTDLDDYYQKKQARIDALKNRTIQ